MKKSACFLALAAALFCGAAHAEKYVVIAPHDLVSIWQEYIVDRQTSFPAITFSVVDTRDIYSAYPYGTGKSCRNPAESIHAYLRANRTDLKYVVLGGPWVDATNLPTTNTLAVTGTTLTIDNTVPGVYVKPASDWDAEPSDMFYACLDLIGSQTYPWDSNGNGEYLDTSDAVASNDLTPDIVVARMALKPYAGYGKQYTPAKLLEGYRAKLARAEEASWDGAGRIFLNVDYVYNANVAISGSTMLRDEYEFYDSADNMFAAGTSTTYVDIEPIARRRIKEQIAPYRTLRPGLAALQQRWTRGYASNEAVANAYYAGDFDFAYVDCHGTAVKAADMNVTSLSKATGLTRILGIVSPCHTGHPDDFNSDCSAATSMGEAAIANPIGGALAGVFNSREGNVGGSFASTFNDGYDGNLTTYFLEGLFQKGYNVGEAWLYMLQTYSALSSSFKPILCEKMLYGDPLVTLAPTVPAEDHGTDAGISKSGQAVTLDGEGRYYVGQSFSCGTLTQSGEDTVLDFGSSTPSISKLVFSAGSATTLRNKSTGALTNLKPITVTDAKVTLETYDAITLSPTTATATTYALSGATLVFSTNPYRGQSNYNEFLYGTVTMANSRLVTDTTDSAVWGKTIAPLKLSVSGTDNSIVSTNGGTFKLSGTSTVTLATGAKLTLDARFVDGGSGTLVLDGAGTVTVPAADTLCGAVEVKSGTTLKLESLPLTRVTSLTIREGATLELPTTTDKGWQVLNPDDTELVIENMREDYYIFKGYYGSADSSVVEQGDTLVVLDGGEVDVTVAHQKAIEQIKAIRFLPKAVKTANAGPRLLELAFFDKNGTSLDWTGFTISEYLGGESQSPDSWTYQSSPNYLFDKRTPATSDETTLYGYSWRPIVKDTTLTAGQCWVQVESATAFAMPSGYSLAVGVVVNRGVTAWEVQVSDDLVNWYTSDTRTGVTVPSMCSWYGSGSATTAGYTLTTPGFDLKIGFLDGAKLLVPLAADASAGESFTLCELNGTYTDEQLKNALVVSVGGVVTGDYSATVTDGKLVVTLSTPTLPSLRVLIR